MNKCFRICCLLFFLSIAFLYAQWEPETRLSPEDGSYSFCNRNIGIAAGVQNVDVGWSDTRYSSAGFCEIYYRRSTNEGITCKPETRLTNHVPGNCADGSIAKSGSMVHLVYNYNPNGGPPWYYDVYYLRSTDNGITWSSDIRLSSDPEGNNYPSIAISDSIVCVASRYDRTDEGHITSL